MRIALDITPAYRELTTIEDTRGTLISVSTFIPEIDPLAVLEMIPNTGKQFFWEKPDTDFSLAGGNEILRIASHLKNVEHILSEIKKNTVLGGETLHSYASPFFLGGAPFDPNRKKDKWKAFGQGHFFLPQWTVVKEGKACLMTVNTWVTEEDTETIVSELHQLIRSFVQKLLSRQKDCPLLTKPELTLISETGFEEWDAGINLAKSNIRSGKLSKVVLAREVAFNSSRPLIPSRLANHLRNQFHSCYTFMYQLPSGEAFVGSTPERLVSFHKKYILTEALAGSISRGKSAKDDALLERTLKESDKDLGEHKIVIDQVLEELQPFTQKSQHPGQPQVRKYSNVQHLHTPISIWLKEEASISEVVKTLHPTPAVGGFPKSTALEEIRKTESFDRGWYAGPIGWFNLNGAGEFAVAIRSGLIHHKKISLYAGCGIVHDSVSSSEWEETKLKLIPMLTALEHA